MRAANLKPDEAWDLPLLHGYAYIAAHEANNPWCAVELASDGYLAQEVKRNR